MSLDRPGQLGCWLVTGQKVLVLFPRATGLPRLCLPWTWCQWIQARVLAQDVFNFAFFTLFLTESLDFPH